MKRLIATLLCVISLNLYAQKVPVIYAQSKSDVYSFTDEQLQADNLLQQFYSKYEDKVFSLQLDSLPTKEKHAIAKALKVLNLKSLYDYFDQASVWSTDPYGCSWYCGAYHFQTVSSSLPTVGKNNYSEVWT